MRQYNLKHFAHTYQHYSGCEGGVFVFVTLRPKSLEYLYTEVVDSKKKILRQFSITGVSEATER
jgi:hypothetical protein